MCALQAGNMVCLFIFCWLLYSKQSRETAQLCCANLKLSEGLSSDDLCPSACDPTLTSNVTLSLGADEVWKAEAHMSRIIFL